MARPSQHPAAPGSNGEQDALTGGLAEIAQREIGALADRHLGGNGLRHTSGAHLGGAGLRCAVRQQGGFEAGRAICDAGDDDVGLGQPRDPSRQLCGVSCLGGAVAADHDVAGRPGTSAAQGLVVPVPVVVLKDRTVVRISWATTSL